MKAILKTATVRIVPVGLVALAAVIGASAACRARSIAESHGEVGCVEGCDGATLDQLAADDLAAANDQSVACDSAVAGSACNVPRHILTIDYGDGYISGSYPANLLPNLSYVQIGNSGSPAQAAYFHTNGVKTIFYTAPGIAIDNAAAGSHNAAYYAGLLPHFGLSPSTNFFFDCAGSHLAKPASVHQLAVDPRGADVQTAYTTAYVTPWASGATPIDYWFFDSPEQEPQGLINVTTGTGGPTEDLCFADSTATKQYIADTVYTPGFAAFTVPLIANGYGALDANGLPPPFVDTLVNVAGGRTEGTYTNKGFANYYVTEHANHNWSGQENTEIYFSNANKIQTLQCGETVFDPGSATGQAYRKFCYASVLLTYNLPTTVLWNLWGGNGVATPSNPSGAKIYPETLLVAMNPVVPEPSNATGVAALLSSGGSYGREYQDCYYDGVRVGSCVFAVNPDETSAHGFPIAGYDVAGAYSMVLRNGPGSSGGICTVGSPMGELCAGAEIQNGGTATFDGPACPGMLAAEQAEICVRP